MSTLTINMGLRHEFDSRWRAFTDERVRQTGGPAIIIDPVMQGPGPDGRITYLDVDPEFLAQLRKEGFGED